MQITKNNSIAGCKLPSVKLVYTEWTNLKKDEGAMAAGQVTFHDSKKRFHVMCTRDKSLVNKLEKTKRDGGDPDFRKEKIDYEKLMIFFANTNVQY